MSDNLRRNAAVSVTERHSLPELTVLRVVNVSPTPKASSEILSVGTVGDTLKSCEVITSFTD